MKNTALRDQGIARAEEHAASVVQDWAGLAQCFLKAAIAGTLSVDSFDATGKPVFVRIDDALSRFQTADFRKWAENRGLPAPPDARAYGGIIKRAVKAGLIVADGYAPTSDPIAHNRPAIVWKVAK